MRRSEQNPSRKLAGANPLGLLSILGLLALVLGLAALSLAARQMNRSEVEAERARLGRALDGDIEGLRQDLAEVATMGGGLQERSWPDRDALFRAENGSAVAETRPGRPSPIGSALASHAVALAGPIWSGAPDTTTVVAVGRDLYEGAAVSEPVGEGVSPASRVVDVGFRPIDDAVLSKLSFAAETRALHLATPGEDAAGEGAVLLLDDGHRLGLSWRPDRPGDRLMLDGSTLIVGLTALFSALVIVRAKRVAGEFYADGIRAIEDSRHDWLSGLPNRLFFNHALENELVRIRRGRKKLGLFHLNLDRFKQINDTFGIEAGDGMIQAVTGRLAKIVEDGNIFARFEGDAFMILQRDVGARNDCQSLAERVQEAMREPFDIGGARITISTSIGIALAPEDASDVTELVRLSNLALFRAKREGRNRHAFYLPTMEEDWLRRTSIEKALQHAIANQGLVLRYQPILSCATGEVVCVEALVRWQHPTEGLIAPDQFISLAEDRGLILPLGEWVLRQACTDARTLPGSVRVAVNVSPIQFKDGGFVAMVNRTLRQTLLDPCRLELELTEGVIMENEDDAVIAMAELRDAGVRLALDDFGTGYSSLIYLRRFAFDKIKIDRAFIEALEPVGESAILVDSVVRLGRALGLTVTAEGIETEEQRDFLNKLGCHELQGYLIARPLSIPELKAFLGNGVPPTPSAPDKPAPVPAVA